MKLNKVSLGLALGFFWAGALLIFGVIGATTSYLDNVVAGLGTVYIGYASTFLGIIL
ncbi:hypothetical protein KKG31_01000 [Patescibacteria group bacterium]|nr:hypothetical protein [Patescibacteria group bacterium]